MGWSPLVLVPPPINLLFPPIPLVVESHEVSPTTRVGAHQGQVPPPQSAMVKKHGEAARDNRCSTESNFKSLPFLFFFCWSSCEEDQLVMRKRDEYWAAPETMKPTCIQPLKCIFNTWYWVWSEGYNLQCVYTFMLHLFSGLLVYVYYDLALCRKLPHHVYLLDNANYLFYYYLLINFATYACPVGMILNFASFLSLLS